MRQETLPFRTGVTNVIVYLMNRPLGKSYLLIGERTRTRANSRRRRAVWSAQVETLIFPLPANLASSMYERRVLQYRVHGAAKIRENGWFRHGPGLFDGQGMNKNPAFQT